MRCVTVAIADRYPVVRCGLMSVLRPENDFNVVASCGDGTTCIEAIRNLSPDIALVGTFMPGLSALEILAAITSEKLGTRVVVLAEACELTIAADWGAYGVVRKDAAPEILLKCLRQVAAGRRVLPLAFWHEDSRPRQEFNRRDGVSENALSLLTERELQITHLVSEGLSNKEVGRRLDLSDGTIKVHLHNIYQKLAISNRTMLAAIEIGKHLMPQY